MRSTGTWITSCTSPLTRIGISGSEVVATIGCTDENAEEIVASLERVVSEAVHGSAGDENVARVPIGVFQGDAPSNGQCAGSRVLTAAGGVAAVVLTLEVALERGVACSDPLPFPLQATKSESAVTPKRESWKASRARRSATDFCAYRMFGIIGS